MTLIPGTRLGEYEVLSSLGEGGMGAVYRARDSKLNRDVALKVLLPAVANDPERLARFQREAQVLASLNHPHIGAIHGLEESNGTIALVLELVDGLTLADRIARGPLPLDEALPIAKQIAEALEAAHEQGIIHRDLKPANIKVRDDGTVKVLDFGLAKALEAGAGGAGRAGLAGRDVMNSPTITSPAQMTGVGIILGTAAYMAPEQARGKAVDKRADIWAFGCVLFEMLTGQRTFPADDITDAIVGIVSKEPEWALLPDSTPGALRRLLERCLRKDPKERLRDIGEVRVAIGEWLAGGFDDPGSVRAAGSSGAAPSQSRWAHVLPWAAATALAAALAVSLASRPRTEPEPDRPLVRLDVDLGAETSLPQPTNSGSNVIISPDGTRLA